MERRRFKPCLPSVVMGNVWSLSNKMDELTALTRNHMEYRECSLMCFTETCLRGWFPHPPGRPGLHRER